MLAGGGALVVKLLSPGLPHRRRSAAWSSTSDRAAEAAAAAAAWRSGVARDAAGVAVDGFALQPMVRRPEARRAHPRRRAPTRSSGRCSSSAPAASRSSSSSDTAVALPPLNSGLAAELVARTRAGAPLAGFRGRAPADVAAVTAR